MSKLDAVDILLVEDNPEDVELAVRALRKARLTHAIQVVADGEEALAYLFGSGADGRRADAHRPRVVFLDLKLPKVSGLDILRRIKSDAAAKTIPVVVLSSSREESDIREAYVLGANSYIVKPVAFEKFGEAVAQLGLYWLVLNEPPR